MHAYVIVNYDLIDDFPNQLKMNIIIEISIIFIKSGNNFKEMLKSANQNIPGCLIIKFFLWIILNAMPKITVFRQNNHPNNVFVKYFGNNNLCTLLFGKLKIVYLFWYISTIFFFSLLCRLVWKDQRTSKLPLRKRTVLLLSCQKICYLFLAHSMSTGPRNIVSLRDHPTTTWT